MDHTTIYRWIQAYAAELEKRFGHTCGGIVNFWSLKWGRPRWVER